MKKVAFQRRQVFQGLIALSAIGGVAACSGADETSDNNAESKSFIQPGFLSTQEVALMTALAGTIIPKTETAGAEEAGVPNTLQALVTEWGDAEFQQYWRSGLTRLDQTLISADGMSFRDMSVRAQSNALREYDAKVFAGEIDDEFYRDFKSTVITAYYMSEAGATEELAYEPVPGEWISCAPLTEFPKTWAT